MSFSNPSLKDALDGVARGYFVHLEQGRVLANEIIRLEAEVALLERELGRKVAETHKLKVAIRAIQAAK